MNGKKRNGETFYFSLKVLISHVFGLCSLGQNVVKRKKLETFTCSSFIVRKIWLPICFFLNIFLKKIFLLVAQMHGYGMLVIGPRQTTFRQTSHNDHMIQKQNSQSLVCVGLLQFQTISISQDFIQTFCYNLDLKLICINILDWSGTQSLPSKCSKEDLISVCLRFGRWVVIMP